MTQYELVPFHLSLLQERKARSALKNHTSLSLRISAANIGVGRCHLSLSPTQLNSIAHKKEQGLGAQVVVSHKALRHAATHGSGIFSSIGSSLIRAGGNALADYVKGSGVRRPTRKTKGGGFFGSLLSGGIKMGANALGDAVGGMGIKRLKAPRRRKTGHGFFSSIGSSLIKAGGNALGNAVSGMGIKRRRAKRGHGIYNPGG